MDTFQRVKKWLAAEVGIREDLITPKSMLGDFLNLDSLDIVELLMSFEEFELEIPEAEIANLPPLIFDKHTTVQQIVDMIERWAKG